MYSKAKWKIEGKNYNNIINQNEQRQFRMKWNVVKHKSIMHAMNIRNKDQKLKSHHGHQFLRWNIADFFAEIVDASDSIKGCYQKTAKKIRRTWHGNYNGII